MLKKKVCILEVFCILSIQCSNVSICGDVHVLFMTAYLKIPADSGKNILFIP